MLCGICLFLRLQYMRRFKSTPPAITVIAISRLHILALCIILLAILNYPYNRKYENAFRLSIPGYHHSTKEVKAFNMAEIFKTWKTEERKYIKFTLSGDSIFDKLTLCAIQYEARKLRMKYDTTDVIRVRFTPDCTYGQFVQVCNIMKIQQIPSYAYADDNCLYAWQHKEY